MTVAQYDEIGRSAVRELRDIKFRKGLPFMINSRELPPHQCYLEYASGFIKLVELSDSRKDFIIIKELTITESNLIREKYQLA